MVSKEKRGKGVHRMRQRVWKGSHAYRKSLLRIDVGRHRLQLIEQNLFVARSSAFSRFRVGPLSRSLETVFDSLRYVLSIPINPLRSIRGGCSFDPADPTHAPSARLLL